MIIEFDYPCGRRPLSHISHLSPLARALLHENLSVRRRAAVEFRGFMNYSLRATEAKVLYFYISLSFGHFVPHSAMM